MEVYIISNSWSAPENDGHEIEAVFSVWDEAVDVFKKMAYEEKQRLTDIYGDIWAEDYTQDDDTYISFGFYNDGFGLDTIYRWELTTAEVQ